MEHCQFCDKTLYFFCVSMPKCFDYLKLLSQIYDLRLTYLLVKRVGIYENGSITSAMENGHVELSFIYTEND